VTEESNLLEYFALKVRDESHKNVIFVRGSSTNEVDGHCV